MKLTFAGRVVRKEGEGVSSALYDVTERAKKQPKKKFFNFRYVHAVKDYGTDYLHIKSVEKTLIVRGYKGMLCEDACSNLANLLRMS
jgi:hypothetical protein